MTTPSRARLAASTALACLAFTAAAASAPTPGHFDPYYSGPPCPTGHVDRTYSQFQVNLADRAELIHGVLRSGDEGEARLVEERDREVQLVSNASRAEWLLTYPLLEGEVGVWARPILGPDCSIKSDSLYVEALFPLVLFDGSIDPKLDLFRRESAGDLQDSVIRYRRALTGSESGEPARLDRTHRHGRAAKLLGEALFAPGAAGAAEPWRVTLMDGGLPASGAPANSVEVVLSGSDGSVGMFGHIAVGENGEIFNVYPKGSDRGAPGAVPLWDYLFNAQRGQALRRPTWVLRLEGLPEEIVKDVRREMEGFTRDLEDGTVAYHPTANNCTIATLGALRNLGFKVADGRYFTKRFPRPAFVHVLHQIPDLVESGKLKVSRVELWFIPQVPVRDSQGGAPNRPLRDRSRMR